MTSSCTRSRSRHSVFGFPQELISNVLPTCEDIFKAYCFYQQKEESLTVNDIIKTVANEVTQVYHTASIPTIAFDSIVTKVKRLIEKGNDLRKYPESKRTSATYHEALSSFNSLFDVCPCKCVDDGVVMWTDIVTPLSIHTPRSRTTETRNCHRLGLAGWAAAQPGAVSCTTGDRSWPRLTVGG